MTRSTIAQLLACFKAVSKGVESDTKVKIMLVDGTEIRLDSIVVESQYCLHTGNTRDSISVLATATPVSEK